MVQPLPSSAKCKRMMLLPLCLQGKVVVHCESELAGGVPSRRAVLQTDVTFNVPAAQHNPLLAPAGRAG